MVSFTAYQGENDGESTLVSSDEDSNFVYVDSIYSSAY